MKNLAIILKDFCKEQYQKYLTKVRLEQEEKTWQNKKATTIDLLNIWLVYLDKQKNLKIYRGLNPDVHEQRREFFVLLNPDIEPRQVEKDYRFLCQNCWIDFLNFLNMEYSEYQKQIMQIEEMYAEKCQQFQDNSLLRKTLLNDLRLEADRRTQLRYTRQIYDLFNANRKLSQEGQRLCEKHNQLENTCCRLSRVLKLTQKGQKPADGYYNNQTDNKLFIFKME